MRNTTRGLFDEQFRLEKISKQNDPLEKLQAHIDFEFFRRPLEDYFIIERIKRKGIIREAVHPQNQLLLSDPEKHFKNFPCRYLSYNMLQE